MTRSEINSIINEMATTLNCPKAYSVFKKNDNPRYILFYYPESDDVYADGINYADIDNLTIEFYSPYREFDSENTIKSILTEYHLAYSCNSSYIASEKVNLTTFITEVIINAEQN